MSRSLGKRFGGNWYTACRMCAFRCNSSCVQNWGKQSQSPILVQSNIDNKNLRQGNVPENQK